MDHLMNANRTPGWYPKEDGSGGVRWWNGSEWTDETPRESGPQTPSTPATSSTRTRPRWLLPAVAAAAVVAVLGIGAAVWAAGQVAGDDVAAPTTSAMPETTPAQPSSPPPAETPVAAPEPTPDFEVVDLGQPLVSNSFTWTINSAEVVDRIETTSGGPIEPAPGTQLVLVKSTYTVTGSSAVDITCGNYDIFIQGFDSDDREMARLFEEPRIPGNPGCNDQLVSGQTAEWNFAYSAPTGGTPFYIVVTDTNYDGNGGWGPESVMRLTP